MRELALGILLEVSAERGGLQPHRAAGGTGEIPVSGKTVSAPFCLGSGGGNAGACGFELDYIIEPVFQRPGATT